MIKDWLKCSAFNLMLLLTLTGCVNKSPTYADGYHPGLPKLPAIPGNFRQLPAPHWCSPTCTEAVWVIDKNSQSQLTQLGSEG